MKVFKFAKDREPCNPDSFITHHGIRCFYWSPDAVGENFGDILSYYFTEKLLGVPKSDCPPNMYLIGSVISDYRAKLASSGNEIGFWQCGIRSLDELNVCKSSSDLIFFGSRGPITSSSMSIQGAIGDAAFVLPRFYTPSLAHESVGKVVFVPHILNEPRTSERLTSIGADICLSPVVCATEKSVENFIDTIVSADFVIAEAMHAAVIAAAYGVPFSFYSEGYLDCPLKWLDLSRSLGIPTCFTQNIQEGRRVYDSLYRSIKIPSVDDLLDSCPFHIR